MLQGRGNVSNTRAAWLAVSPGIGRMQCLQKPVYSSSERWVETWFGNIGVLKPGMKLMVHSVTGRSRSFQTRPPERGVPASPLLCSVCDIVETRSGGKTPPEWSTLIAIMMMSHYRPFWQSGLSRLYCNLTDKMLFLAFYLLDQFWNRSTLYMRDMMPWSDQLWTRNVWHITLQLASTQAFTGSTLARTISQAPSTVTYRWNAPTCIRSSCIMRDIISESRVCDVVWRHHTFISYNVTSTEIISMAPGMCFRQPQKEHPFVPCAHFTAFSCFSSTSISTIP